MEQILLALFPLVLSVLLSGLLAYTCLGGVFVWTNVQSGIYTISAIAHDQYQDSDPATLLVTVHGPIVQSISPSNSSAIVYKSPIPVIADFSYFVMSALIFPSQIALEMGTIGPNPIASVTVNGTAPGGKHFSYTLTKTSETNYTTPAIELTNGVYVYLCVCL